MLLAVSGIVHATPSRRTFDAVISEPVATRWLRTSPLAESHAGAGSVPAVASASPIVRDDERHRRREIGGQARPFAREARASRPDRGTRERPDHEHPAKKNGAFERSTAAI